MPLIHTYITTTQRFLFQVRLGLLLEIATITRLSCFADGIRKITKTFNQYYHLSPLASIFGITKPG